MSLCRRAAPSLRLARQWWGSSSALAPSSAFATVHARRLSTISSSAAALSMRQGLGGAGFPSPSTLSNMGDFTLFQLSEMGEPGSVPHAGASRERLRREIMAVDGVEYAATSQKLLEISAHINPNDPVLEAPFKLAIYTALLTGSASIPLTFHYATAAAFNDMFVTADAPEVGGADTFLERDQRLAIGGKTAMQSLMESQAAKLVAAYPQYDANILRRYGAVLAVRDEEVDTIRREQARLDTLSDVEKGPN